LANLGGYNLAQFEEHKNDVSSMQGLCTKW